MRLCCPDKRMKYIMLAVADINKMGRCHSGPSPLNNLFSCLHRVQGCGAGEGGKLTACNVAVSNSQCNGFRVWGGGEAELQACKVTKCGDTGVLATDPGSLLLMMVRTKFLA